jgi:hypothetical protein
VIKSPRECKGVVVNAEDLKFRVLMIHKDKKELEGTNVLKYIEYGESHKFGKGDKASIPAQRPTCASRERWYDLGAGIRSDISFPERFRKRHLVLSNEENVYLNKNLYGITSIEKEYSKPLCAILNSSFMIVTTEVGGRLPGGGGGPLDLDVKMVESLSILNPSKIAKSQLQKLSEAFGNLSQRRIGSVFEELGAETPEDVSLDKVKPDRRELDRVVFKILGLTEEEQLEVYKAVVDLVKSRIEKAKSVPRNKNKKKYSEVDLLVKRTLDSLGGEDILKNFFDGMGEYEEMILPRFRKEAKIEKTLTGWQLTDGKERVLFDDKKQAVYCGILAFMGIEKAKIPKELDEKKVNALRNIADSVFQAINTTLETITDKKTRDVVKSLVIGGIISRTNETGTSV